MVSWIMTALRSKRWLLFLVLAGCLASRSAATEIAGDGTSMWVVQPFKEQQIMILHRDRTNLPQSLYRAFGNPLNGRVTEHGVAASGDRLWLVYEDQSVQSISRDVSQGVEFAMYQTHTARQLPKAVVLRGFTVGDNGPWALVGVSDRQVLAVIDGATDDALAVGLDGADQLSDGGQVLEVDRLLHLGGRDWQTVSLPQQWRHGTRAWVVIPRPSSERPVLFSAGREGGLDVYRPNEQQGWSQQQYPLKISRHIQIAAMPEGQLVVAQNEDYGLDKLVVNVSMLRNEGLRSIGEFVLAGQTASNWKLVPGSGAYEVGIVSWDPQDQLSITQMNLQGEMAATARLKVMTQPRWPSTIGFLMLVIMLALATLIMFAYWRQGQAWNQLDLPHEMVLADLLRRIAAGLIDLVPIMTVIVYAYDVKPDELVNQWSAPRSDQWTQMLASLIGMGCFFAHTFVTELFTARTVGKALMGLRVSTMSGQRPMLWQVFIRNIMKPFELFSWPLLVMPLISPNRQRLGDLVARTVIVAKAQKKQTHD